MLLAIVLIVLSAAWRIVAVHEPALSNFAPMMAMTFCGAVYFRNRWMWLVPFAALSLSDFYLDRYHATQFGYTWSVNGALVRNLCFIAALAIGWAVSRRRTWLNIFSGSLGASLFFYLVTNTGAFIADVDYAKTAAGWWQAMTVGHPQYAPTLLFFRNTLASDLAFTGLFAATMEFAELRAGRPSLLRQAVRIRG